MKTLVGVFLAGSILILIGSACGDSSTSAGGTNTEESSTPTATESSVTPEERVREAIGDEVEAGGYAGNLEVKNVTFEGKEAQVTVKTPEGGLEGASCGDLDDGAQAVFETIYNDAEWKGGALTVFKGGLVDTQTGQELPDVNTGIYTIHAGQARQIDWSDEDALLNIDWSNYRDFCHPALQ
jgi:hypothetical protein